MFTYAEHSFITVSDQHTIINHLCLHQLHIKLSALLVHQLKLAAMNKAENTWWKRVVMYLCGMFDQSLSNQYS